MVGFGLVCGCVVYLEVDFGVGWDVMGEVVVEYEWFVVWYVVVEVVLGVVVEVLFG